MKEPQVAVGAVVFKENRVLLVQRKNEPAAGQWAVPGGRVNRGETLKAAAERELFEETGIRIEAGKPVYVFEYIRTFHYVIIDLDAVYISGEAVAADDALDVRWVSAAELTTLDVTSSTLQLLREKYDFTSDPDIK